MTPAPYSIAPDWSRLYAGWRCVLEPETQKLYFLDLANRIGAAAHNGALIYPPQTSIYNAFHHFNPSQTRVVILGQDPYHGPGQAMGLSFSVSDGVKLPPSLKNIYKEVASTNGHERARGDLSDWAAQGVLLLNSSLTVETGKAGSHAKWGWHRFTDYVINYLSTEHKNIVFMLWGKHAQSKSAMIDEQTHLILSAPHPSPLSAYRGFLGCGHFAKTNEWLVQHEIEPIRW